MARKLKKIHSENIAVLADSMEIPSRESVERDNDVRWSGLRELLVESLDAVPGAREAVVDGLVERLGLRPDTRIAP